MNTPPPPRPPGPAERKALALQRLEASRTRLIQRLYPAPAAHPPEGGGSSQGMEPWLAALLARVGREGGARSLWRLARALARRWWVRQPWHGPVALAAQALTREARPLVQRHPWACLGAAVALGAALMAARPWIGHTVQRRAPGWRAHLGRSLWQQLNQAPVQMALVSALSAWLATRERSDATGTPPPAPPPA